MILCSFLSWETSGRSQVLLGCPQNGSAFWSSRFFSLGEFHIQVLTHNELAKCPEIATQWKFPIIWLCLWAPWFLFMRSQGVTHLEANQTFWKGCLCQYSLFIAVNCRQACSSWEILSLAVRKKNQTFENKLLLLQCSPNVYKGRKPTVTSGSSQAMVISLGKKTKELHYVLMTRDPTWRYGHLSWSYRGSRVQYGYTLQLVLENYCLQIREKGPESPPGITGSLLQCFE